MWKTTDIKPLSKSFISFAKSSKAFKFDNNLKTVELFNTNNLVSSNYKLVTVNFDLINDNINAKLTNYYIDISNIQTNNQPYNRLNYTYIPYKDYLINNNLFYYYGLNRFETDKLLNLFIFTNNISDLYLTIKYRFYNIINIENLKILIHNLNLITKLEKITLSNSDLSDKLINIEYINSISDFSNLKLDFYFKFNISNLDSTAKVLNILPKYQIRNCLVLNNNIVEYVDINNIIFEKSNYKRLNSFEDLNNIDIKYFYIDSSYIYLIE